MNTKSIDLVQVLNSKNPSLGSKLRPFTRYILRVVGREKDINEYLKALQNLEPGEFCRRALKKLKLKVEYRGIEHLSSVSNPVVCANHPTGGAEGLALLGYLWDSYGQVQVPANDILGIIPPLRRVVIPVDAKNPKRAHLAQLKGAFRDPSPLLFFPAGVTARLRGGVLKEYPWNSGFVTLSRQANRPIVPVRVTGRNSWHFYTIFTLRRLFGVRFNLEMALLVDELFRQKGKTMICTFLPPVFPGSSAPANQGLRNYDKELALKLSRKCGGTYG